MHIPAFPIYLCIVSSIKNILFDLGNVIIDIDIPRTRQELVKLLRRPDLEDQVMETLKPVLLDYEKGLLSDELFINALLRHARPQVYAQQVIRAWNAMLIDIPAERLDFLKQLRDQQYRLFVLSNTNGLHLSWVNAFMEKNYQAPSLEPWFDRLYYSHLVKARKPETASFEYVLRDAGIRPEETLYIEDTYENIESAQTLGIRTLYLTGGHDVITALKQYLSIKP